MTAMAIPTSSVLSRLERDLRELWSAPEAPGELPKSRVSTMNLVVIASSRELAERYTPIVNEVTQSIPARAIVASLDANAEGSALDGTVSAVCAVGESSTALCSELISLTASGSVCMRMASAIEALLLPEIPTVLVWLGRVHVDDPVFSALANQSRRVILDTEYTSLTSLLQLARWTRLEVDRPDLGDLAWTRLAPWQEMCARFFDDPKLRDHATRITRLTIKQASDKGARLGSEGSLLLGWFATRLGWKVTRVGGTLRYRRPDDALVNVELGAVPRPPGVAPAALAMIAFEADANGIVARGSIERELASGIDPHAVDADVLVWKLSVPFPCATEQRVRLGANKGAKLLDRTLHRASSDPALLESVAFAEEIFDEGIACE